MGNVVNVVSILTNVPIWWGKLTRRRLYSREGILFFIQCGCEPKTALKKIKSLETKIILEPYLRIIKIISRNHFIVINYSSI